MRQALGVFAAILSGLDFTASAFVQKRAISWRAGMGQNEVGE